MTVDLQTHTVQYVGSVRYSPAPHALTQLVLAIAHASVGSMALVAVNCSIFAPVVKGWLEEDETTVCCAPVMLLDLNVMIISMSLDICSDKTLTYVQPAS